MFLCFSFSPQTKERRIARFLRAYFLGRILHPEELQPISLLPLNLSPSIARYLQNRVSPWEPARPLHRSPGPCAPEMRKKSRKCLRPRDPKSLQKVSGTVREVSGKCPESVRRVFFGVFRNLLETSWVAGPEAPGDIVETLSAFRARRARRPV